MRELDLNGQLLHQPTVDQKFDREKERLQQVLRAQDALALRSIDQEWLGQLRA
jgi:tRNA threonylcarbamoyladenosine modification (KEOPS) complex  Pcc1 subunit